MVRALEMVRWFKGADEVRYSEVMSCDSIHGSQRSEALSGEVRPCEVIVR